MRSSAIARPQDPAHRALRVWLYLVAGLVFAIVLVGGATRLTESGLSIVEWKPITGVVPPMGEGAWQAEFQQYQTIPQYRSLNADMTLPQFKTIYWWEWTHRLLGRVIGAAFLLPFLWFLWRGAVPAGTKLRLWGIFGLGAFQGAVGWWMVASGLADRVSVSQYRLAFHLTLACLIYSAMLWTAQRLSPRMSPEPTPRVRASSVALVVLVLGQLYLGALVAGLDAGRIYNTWPLIDGGFIPDSARLFFDAPLWRNFFENTLTVQFDHRMLAYLIFALALLHALDAWRGSADHRTRTGATILALAVTVQAGLGITTLLMQAPLDLSIVHQAMAMVVLTVAVVHAAWMYPRRVEAALPAAALAPSSR